MKKRVIARVSSLFLALFLLCGVFGIDVFAAESRVFDDAGLLTISQISVLESKIKSLKTELSMDLVVATTNDAEGKTARRYADDFYDYGGFGVGSDKSGVLLLIDMDNREVYISTTGAAIDYLTDARIESILDSVQPKVKSKDYNGAVNAFLEKTRQYVKAGIPEGQYQYDEATGKVTKRSHTLTPGKILLFAAISVGAGLLSAGIVAAKYKTGYKKNAYPMREKSRVHMIDSRDIFLHKHVTSRRIQTDHNSGGGGGGSGSSTHSSSSGTTHGGGGRGF